MSRGFGQRSLAAPARWRVSRSRERKPASPELRTAGTQLLEAKLPALAQSRANAGIRPSSSVTTTPSVIAAVVNAPGTVTVGPSGAGSLKYISTITRR